MSFRYPAGLITAGSPVTPEYPSGVWTNQQAAPYINGQVWANDPFFNQTVLLLHGDGTNGAQNNTFLDSSSNNFTITRNGNTTQGTFSPFSVPNGYWGNVFDGTGDYLTATMTGATAGTGSITIEFYCFINSNAASGYFFTTRSGGTGGDGIDCYFGATNTGITVTTSGVYIANNVGTLSVGKWIHVAIVRNGSTNWTVYLNGVSISTQSSAITLSGTALVIGANSGGSNSLPGAISNFRIVNAAVYTSNFTPPTSPLTAIASTSFLSCQSNRFIDNSSNAFAITRNGDVQVTPFDPFLPTGAYSPSVTGGSGYFDGSGDYLTITSGVTNQFDPGSAFTLEGWFYQTSTANCIIFEVRGNTDSFANADGILCRLWTNFNGNSYFQFKSGTSAISILGATPPNNTWNHLAVGYNGTTTRFWINGVSVGTSTSSYTVPTYNRVTIGNNNNQSAPNPFFGYLSNMRFVKGSDVYGVSNTSITVPTTPLTAITNTSLLCNFTNAGILDNTMFNNLETIGNAQIDTSIKEYGTGSMEFDGAGDELKTTFADSVAGGGDFTIEFWFNPNSTATSAILDLRSDGAGFDIYFVSGNLGISTSGTLFMSTSGVTFTTGTWFHTALVRFGTGSNNWKVYVNGISRAQTTNTTNFTAKILRIGNGANGAYNGYIDDLRITKGIARYTADFTSPIARFPNQ